MSNKQKNYRGALSLEEIAEGIAACLQNARALVRDATVLMWLRRYPRALTCLLVANEELGKFYIIGTMASIPHERQDQWKMQWKKFLKHSAKGTAAAMESLPEQFRISLEVAFHAFPIFAQTASSMENLRQASLYVDFSERDRRWTSPSNINRVTVKNHLSSTRAVLKKLEYVQQLGFCSVQALRIQHEELSPAFSRLPPVKDVTNNDMRMLEPYLRRCLSRQIRELGITFPDKAIIMGKPWREFIED